MGFNLKTWVNRISEYPTRRKLTKSDGSTELVTVERAEGQVSQEGNAFSADEMNDLEKRISDGFDELNNDLDKRLLNGIGNSSVLQKGTDIDNIRYPSSTFSAWVAFNDPNHDEYVAGSNPLNASYNYYGIMLFMKNAQIFIKYPENRAYSRVFANDSWSSWGDHAKTTDLPPDFKLFRNFDGPEDTLVWSIQTGQPVMGLAVENCCFGFRKNCPIDGQLSLVIDGRFYQNEGQCMCLDTQNYSDYAAPTDHKQAFTADELDTYTSDQNTMGVTPAGVKKAINGRFSLSGTTLYINTL